MSDFLAEMVEAAHARVAAARQCTPLRRPQERPEPGRLAAALRAVPGAARPSVPAAPVDDPPEAAGPAVAPLIVIAEVKRRSPSKGDIALRLDAAAQACAYEAAGADAISVLTEPARFGGSLADLRDVCAAVGVPVLRKDFIVDPYQVWEAAGAGAAAVLLIAAALPGKALATLLGECRLCHLDALVEVHDETDLERAVAAGADLVGVNNRDLTDLSVDLAVTERLAPLAPPDVLIVGESGVATPADARRLAGAGARAVLVGEALVRTPPGGLAEAIAALRGSPRPAEARR